MNGIKKSGYYEDAQVKVLLIGSKEQEAVSLGFILPTERFGLDKLLPSIDAKTVYKWLEYAADAKKRVKVSDFKLIICSINISYNFSSNCQSLRSYQLGIWIRP